MRNHFLSSRYTFSVPISDGVLLYSAKTGAVLKLSGKDGRLVANCLSGPPQKLSTKLIPSNLLESLLSCGFLVPEKHDEIKEIQDRFFRARKETPMVITITTTMDCNLGCYYCYEDRSEEKLELTDIDHIIDFVKVRLNRSEKKRLHVDWYGGEPLLNQTLIESASLQLQKLCNELGVVYAASIISNGTLWPPDIANFIARHKILQVQISFDGMKRNHDQRRRYRNKKNSIIKNSSFDRAVDVVDQLLNIVRVDLRFNIDAHNQTDIIDFFAFAETRGWFEKTFPAVIQPARISAYSERSGFLRNSELTSDKYNLLRAQVQDRFEGVANIEETEVPDGFPFPKTSVCAALANDSAVVGADSRIYRCGLQVSESHRATGTINKPMFKGIQIVRKDPNTNEDNQAEWWNSFDPTKLPKCSKCSFLPICWGGCPKKHLENDEHAISEQSRYWRKNLAKLILKQLPNEAIKSHEFTEIDQFR